MDTMHEFGYSIGTAEELKKGKLKRSAEIPSLETNSSGLIIPKFVGVYQRTTFVPEDKEEKEYLAQGDGEIEKAEDIRGRIYKMILSLLYGKEDGAHHDLIHVVYDGKFLSKSLARQCFGNSPDRIVFSKTEELPDFYEKDTSIFTTIVEETIKSMTGRSDRTSEEIARSYIDTLKEYQQKYGLIGAEYLVLDGAVSKLNPSCKSIISNLDDLIKNLGEL